MEFIKNIMKMETLKQNVIKLMENYMEFIKNIMKMETLEQNVIMLMVK